MSVKKELCLSAQLLLHNNKRYNCLSIKLQINKIDVIIQRKNKPEIHLRNRGLASNAELRIESARYDSKTQDGQHTACNMDSKTLRLQLDLGG